MHMFWADFKKIEARTYGLRYAKRFAETNPYPLKEK